ncbi:MAG: hypothetical protein RQ826_15145, partial [Xanthomonadales bacterium]|nr:hypothetical protein [Xanthomonadales bacterium]
MTVRFLPVVLAASCLLCGATVAETAAPDFDIGDSLKIQRILEQPQLRPDGSAIAYVTGDWQ